MRRLFHTALFSSGCSLSLDGAQGLTRTVPTICAGAFASLEDLTCPTRDEYQVWLKEGKPTFDDARAASHTSSPFVFSGDTFIGGCDDTLDLLAEAGRRGSSSVRANAVAANSADGPALPFAVSLPSMADIEIPDLLPTDEVIPSWRLLQENRLVMEAAESLVAQRALAVSLSGTPANPPRALAYQMQKRLELSSLPKVEMVLPGMAIAVMNNVEDYLAVTANPTLKICAC